MAKQKNHAEPVQLEMFEADPAIKDFGIQTLQLSAGKISGSFIAATEASDITTLTTARWADAFAEYLIKLCKGDEELIYKSLSEAIERIKQTMCFLDGTLSQTENENITPIQRRRKNE